MANLSGISWSVSSRRARAAGAVIALAAVALASTAISCAGSEPPPKTPQAVAPSPPPPPPPPPAVTLLPVDVARASVIATLVAPTLNGALESGIALARQATPLPLDPASVREMALNQLGVPPEIAAQLELGAPISGAVVASGNAEPAKAAFTFTVKAGTDTPKFLSSLGTVTSRRGPVWQIQTPHNGEGWFLPIGNVLVFADSEAGLSRAANLALEARRPVKDDVSIVIYPDGLALSSGTDVKTALDSVRALIEDRTEASSGTKLGEEGRAQLRELVAYAADVATAEIALDLKPDKGVILLARLRPRPASALEAIGRNVASTAIDPLLGGKNDSGLVVTSAYPARTIEQLQRQRGRLPVKDANGKAPGKDVAAAGKLLDALIEGLTGTLSMVGRLQPALSFELAYPIKDAAAAAKIEAALLATDRAALAALVRPEVTGAAMEIKVKQGRTVGIGKGRRAASWTVLPELPNDSTGIVKKLIGPKGLDVHAAVVKNDAGDRLVFIVGPTGKARLTEMVGGKTEAPKGDVADAVAMQGGRSLYYYIDLREPLGMAGAVGGKEMDPRVKVMAGLLKTSMPVLGGVTGDASGKVITLDLTLPPSCLAGIGSLVTGLMAAGAAPPPEAAMAAPAPASASKKAATKKSEAKAAGQKSDANKDAAKKDEKKDEKKDAAPKAH